jgi:hypothetical protein
LSWIRKYPFGEEDALDIMLEFMDFEAQRNGLPLTEEEKQLLRSETPKVAPDQEPRLLGMVKAILEREMSSDQSPDYKKRNFGNAIEWAGDISYPYVVQLAERASGRASVSTRSKLGYLVRLVMTGLVIVFIMLLVVGIVGIVSDKVGR